MDTNRFKQNTTHRPVTPVRQVPGYGSVTLSQPQSAQQIVTVQQSAPQPVVHHQTHHVQQHAVAAAPAVEQYQPQLQAHVPASKPLAHHKADTATVSIKLKIPALHWPTFPPVMRQYTGFWWLLGVAAILIFVAGYLIGQGHAAGKNAQPATPAVTYLLITNREA